MSADNWATCPKCKAKAIQERADLLGRIRVGHGKIPADEYMALVEESARPIVGGVTLREDWELGIHRGKFSVYYSAACEDCGFTYVHVYEEELAKSE